MNWKESNNLPWISILSIVDIEGGGAGEGQGQVGHLQYTVIT